MLSIIVPVYNEEESLPAFFDELLKVLPSLDKDLPAGRQGYEIIFVDDGSQDASLLTLQSFIKQNKHVRVFSFRRNLGKAEALTLGFSQAKGDYIVTLDADLQDKPTEIHKLLAKAQSGVDVVCGWRKDRRDKSNMKLISKAFNWVVGKLFDVRLHDYNCGLKVYTNEAAKSLRLYGGMHRFIPFLVFEQGFSVDEVAIEHAPRKYGSSKYGFSKVWKDLPDLFSMFFLAKYSKRPLHFFGVIGIISILIGATFLGYLTFIHYAFNESVGTRPLLLVGVMFIISGFQIFFTGFLADFMLSISHRSELSSEKDLHFPLKYISDKQR